MWSVRAGFVAVAFLLGCSGLFGTPEEQSEWRYEWRMEDIDEVLAVAGPEDRVEIEAKKAAFEEEFAALPPPGPERVAALDDLTSRMQDAVDGWQPIVDAQAAAAEAAVEAEAEADAAELDAYKATFVGLWQGGGVTLSISPEYHVDYEKKTGATSSAINAPITSFRRKAFDVGMFGITTTFHVDDPPHQVDGKWTMTLDGVELRRVE